MEMFRLTLDDSDVTTEREVRSFYEPGEGAVQVESPSYRVLLNEFIAFVKACGYHITKKDMKHLDAVLFGTNDENDDIPEKETGKLYLVEHTTSDFNRFCIVRAANATDAKKRAKKENYDPLWKPGYDKFRLSEFKATLIEKLDGMESRCSDTFG